MDSIMQIRSNRSHPASHCSMWAIYDFPSTVVVGCLGFAWIPSGKSTQIFAILLATVPSVPDMTFPAQ
jgi:hypothetical protein